MRVEDTIEIKRPLGDVFKYVSDVGNYPEWMAHVLEVQQARRGRRRTATGSSWPSSLSAAALTHPTREAHMTPAAGTRIRLSAALSLTSSGTRLSKRCLAERA